MGPFGVLIDIHEIIVGFFAEIVNLFAAKNAEIRSIFTVCFAVNNEINTAVFAAITRVFTA